MPSKACFKTPLPRGWNNIRGDGISRMYFDALSKKYKFSLTEPWNSLSDEAKNIILYGTKAVSYTHLAVLSAPAEDLKTVEGLGESAAVLLKVAGQIGRKARLADAVQSCPMTDVETAGAYLLERYAGETHEIVYELCLDRKGKLLACKRLNDGGASSAALDIRKAVSYTHLLKEIATL